MKRIETLFIVLLFIFFIWYLIYELTSYNTYMNNSVMQSIIRVYSSAIPPLVGILISFVSTIYALKTIYKTRNEKTTKKYFMRRLIFAIFSFIMHVFNCIVFWGIAKYILFYR
jgi:hypothetical protein